MRAEQHIGERMARLDPQEPADHQAGSRFRRLVQHQRPAALQHQNHRLADRHHRRDQIALRLRDADVDPRLGLARHTLALADHHNHDIGRAGGLDRCLDPAVQRRFGLGSAHDRQPRRIVHRRAEALIDRHGIGRVAEQHPGPVQMLTPLGERPDQGDPG